jgi:lysylphosphatidylglycerol synthetase-like protein (DUF2156 family)
MPAVPHFLRSSATLGSSDSPSYGTRPLQLSQPSDTGALASSFDPQFKALSLGYAVNVLRITGASIAIYQVIFLVCDHLKSGRLTPVITVCHVLNILFGLALLSATFTHKSLIENHWRGTLIAVCTAVLLSMGLIAALQHKPFVVVMSSILFLLGAGAIFPWEPSWQALFTVVPIAMAALTNLTARHAINTNGWL